jgi:hypothetical protein
MNFQENPCTGRRDTTEKAHYCPCKVLLIIDRQQLGMTKDVSYVTDHHTGHARYFNMLRLYSAVTGKGRVGSTFGMITAIEPMHPQ